MFLFMILALVAFFLILFLVFCVSVGGATMLIVFGDVIVCIGVIVAIIVAIVRSRSS